MVNSYVGLWNAGFKRVCTLIWLGPLCIQAFNVAPCTVWASVNVWLMNEGLQVVAAEPQQGLVNNKILMLPKSRIRGITGRVAIYFFKNWWGRNTLKTKQRPKQNKRYSGNQSSEKWKISFKSLNTSYHTKVKAIQIVGCCAYQDINYDGLCSKPIGSGCYCIFMKVNETLEIIRKKAEKRKIFCLCAVPGYACTYSPEDNFSCNISKVT